MKIPFLKVDEEAIKNIDFDAAVVEKAILASASAKLELHDQRALLAGGKYDAGYEKEAVEFTAQVSPSGARFYIPIAIPEGIPSGDARSFEENSITIRDLPLPLMWQIKTGQGHDGSVVVGRIDSIERVRNGVGNARGVFDTGVFGREAERLVRGRFIRGVSVDLDNFEASEEDEPASSDLELASGKRVIKNKKLLVENARLMGITIVPKPAFQECTIMIEEEPTLSTQSDFVVEDGVYEAMLDDMDTELAALAASAAPIVPPADWFEKPHLTEPTPLTIDDNGRVFGHIAAWHVDHIGLPQATRPPRSASKYAYFHTGVVRVDNGKDVPVGQLTLAGGHASMYASAADAVRHYDDTGSAVADIHLYEDAYGIVAAGALRPDVTPTQVRALRASAPSGDWRPISNTLELVAICQVNVPGFPVARSMVAGGQIQALVAAGAQPLAEIRESRQTNQLETRLRALEYKEFATRRDSAIKRMEDMVTERNQKLAAMVASAESRMRPELDAAEQRKQELADKVAALVKKFNS